MLKIAEWWPVITVSAVDVTDGVKIIILRLALRDTKPEARPAIITALAEMFRWWRLR
jgi:hypothetical protein